MSDFLSSLSVETAALPESHAGRNRKVKDNPFVEWVQGSYSDKTGRSVTIPGANVKEACYLIRSAASTLGLGVRIVVQNGKGETLDRDAINKLAESNSKAQTKVLFQGKDKRAYQRKNGENGAETAAE